MTATPPDRAGNAHSPAAERLREALGWDRLPEMSPEQEEAFQVATQRASEAARRFYGCSPVNPPGVFGHAAGCCRDRRSSS